MVVKEFSVSTSRQVEFVEITSKVKKIISETGIKNGGAFVFVPHTTAGITINENADPSVVRDIIMKLNHVISENDAYTHAEGNSPAHIKASLVGNHIYLIILGGRPVLGTWQGIFLCEFDGPRTRKVIVQAMETK
ncbi:MAG: YjbQ family protein [Elusimicrobia bacterium]|nr:YjbQ family protein [Elusimicrobiota bacterium]